MAKVIGGNLVITWCVDDVASRVADKKLKPLTDSQLLRVLEVMADGYDRHVGINWKVMDWAISYVRREV